MPDVDKDNLHDWTTTGTLKLGKHFTRALGMNTNK